ncbi:hypothetical protein DVH05_005458 [Phytophthora capsici]|nr:hypothetical protein DVH05_005458 [Phytophthora capsici]
MGNHSSTDTRPQVTDNWDASQMTSQKGKLVVVTGANSGIGYQASLELARKGADVVLACRSEARGKQAEKEIREALASTPDSGSVKFMMLDVSDLGSVQKFADEFKSTHDRLDILINNAGIMDVPFSTTVDGYERQFATNHLGHFALTARLFPLLKASTPSRVVNTSSIFHSRAALKRFTSGSGIMYPSAEGYNSMDVYSESKLNNLLFTFELTRRMKAGNVTGVTSVVCHPGVTATNMTNAPFSESGWLHKLMWSFTAFQDVACGALPTLYAATGSDVENDDFYGASKFFQMRGPAKRVEPAKTAYDRKAAENLWDESERLAKLQFDVKN